MTHSTYNRNCMHTAVMYCMYKQQLSPLCFLRYEPELAAKVASSLRSYSNRLAQLKQIHLIYYSLHHSQSDYFLGFWCMHVGVATPRGAWRKIHYVGGNRQYLAGVGQVVTWARTPFDAWWQCAKYEIWRVLYCLNSAFHPSFAMHHCYAECSQCTEHLSQLFFQALRCFQREYKNANIAAW